MQASVCWGSWFSRIILSSYLSMKQEWLASALYFQIFVWSDHYQLEEDN